MLGLINLLGRRPALHHGFISLALRTDSMDKFAELQVAVLRQVKSVVKQIELKGFWHLNGIKGSEFL